MKIEDINKSTWFINRYVNHVPCHFVPTRTPVSDENLAWVYQKTFGRFSIIAPAESNNDLSFYNIKLYSFEDPKEAVQYELTWS